jgi:AcrR family transcriptional regulator
MQRIVSELSPRKLPVQARSIRTIDTIFEATIQVLLALGLGELTTTKVAERAGVSVGTLYQYFPNKQALLSAVLRRHLLEIVQAIEEACLMNRGTKLVMMTRKLVDAYLNAKLIRPDVSKALYAVALEIEASSVVEAMTQRVQAAVRRALATVSDRRIEPSDTVSIVLTTSLIGPVQAFLLANRSKAEFGKLRQHLHLLATSYLRSCSKNLGS